MIYSFWDMERDRHNTLSFWTVFYPFTPLWTEKIKILKKWKKIPEDIIIFQMYTINEHHMMYGSWDMECNRQNFLSFWTVFCPFILLKTWKIKILKKWKNCQEILSFYTCIPQMKIIWCMVPVIWSVTDRIFLSFCTVVFLFNPLTTNPKNQNFEKMKKTLGDIMFLHMCTIYDVWFLRYRAQQTEFLSLWTIFYTFTPLTTQKVKILKKWKKHLEILSFYTSVP